MNRTPLDAILLAGLLLALSLAGPLHAAEAPAPAPPAPAEDAEAEAPTGPAAAPDAGEDATVADAGPTVDAADDVFVPSVEVSEDTSVPFPVDI